MKKFKRTIALTVVLLLTTIFDMTTFASNTGNVAGAVEGTQKTASSQIGAVVNNMMFPAIDLVLTVLFSVKVATAYMDHRRHGQIEWAPAAILFAGLVFGLFTPMYIWQIVGI